MSEFGDLEARLDSYGPFPPTRRRIILFGCGQDHEDHGPALPSTCDTLFSQAFCSGVALRTGIRYIAHVPFSTDHAESARHFSPVFMPEPEWFEKTCDYCAAIVSRMSPRPEGIVIFTPWHGMHPMEANLDEFAERLAAPVRQIGDAVVDATWRLQEHEYAESPLRDLVQEGLGKRYFQHAGFFDYCVAEALSHLDRPKLEALRVDMERDLEGTLRKHPGVADLAGYVRYGGPEFDSLREVLGIKPGGPYPPVDPKWENSCPLVGRAIVQHTIDLMSEVVVDFERSLFGPDPWNPTS